MLVLALEDEAGDDGDGEGDGAAHGGIAVLGEGLATTRLN